jgi:4-hydroxybenzoate polyprenyltransferase
MTKMTMTQFFLTMLVSLVLIWVLPTWLVILIFGGMLLYLIYKSASA